MRRLAPLVLLLFPSLAAADRVTVKGTVLEGTVKSVSGGKVVMSTVYGDGDISIKTEDVTAIETEAPFHVYKADDGTVVGRVVDITPDAVTVADEGGTRTEVAFSDVQAVPRDYGEEASFVQRRRTESPWWSGNFDFSFNSTEGATDTTAFQVGFGAIRERGPSRLKLGASYIRGTTQNEFPDATERGNEEVTANEVRGWIRQEYDFAERWFGFGSVEGEHDGVEELSYRYIPKVGVGYKIVDNDKVYLAVDTGPSYVYEKFYDGTRNHYLALAFGGESRVKLPYDASWFVRLDYVPSVSDWAEDYRIQGETGLLLPLIDPLNLKASYIEEYNSQPSENTPSTTRKTLLGLSLVY